MAEVVLLVDEPRSDINIDFLSYIEDEEFFFFFFQYSWGMDSYHKTFKGVDKDMVNYQKYYMESARKKRKGTEAKYAIYGYFFSLHYWAYEAIKRLPSKFTTYHGLQSPRMLRWSFEKIFSVKELVELFDRHDVSDLIT